MEVADTSTARPPETDGAMEVARGEVMDAIARARTQERHQKDPEAALRAAENEIQTLKEALRTRTVIGQAVGLLMHESTITAEAAFARLVQMSSHANVKLRDIAQRIVTEANERGTA
jgi:AmiR/NasT family two-component response regulator